VSHFSKAKTTTKNSIIERRKAAAEKEEQLTGKPNEYILDRNANTATLKQHIFTGHSAQKEVTDKPNNIRAPISFGSGFGDAEPRF
jgi:hypothetical protein